MASNNGAAAIALASCLFDVPAHFSNAIILAPPIFPNRRGQDASNSTKTPSADLAYVA